MAQLLENLNPEQLAAVTLPNESAMILAGAGSGKTRVLTTRIAWLIQGGQVTPNGILAVTFTNKASREMLTRLTASLPINPRGMWIGTFHGLCNRLLRAHHRDAGLPQLFQILDSSDQLAAIKRLCKAMNVDDEKFPPREVQYFINNSKDEGLRASSVEAFDTHTKRMVELYQAYDEQCQREGVVDFAELLLRTYELLQRNEPLREHYRARFSHILVDEFQDTNKLQYKWLKLLKGPQTAMFAVGDDDQSIYAFRGANVGNMRDFERDFAVKNLIRLEQNYRSHGNILTAANALIKNNANRLGKNLWTAAGQGEPLRVYEAPTDFEEARFIVEEVKMLANEGMRRSDMAVLYRSNAQSRVIEQALFSAGIPYRVYGGLRFFERREVKDALAYLRLIASSEDDGAFLRAVNFPPRGNGARSVEQLQDAAKQLGGSLFAAAGLLTGKAGTSIGAFIRLISDMRTATAGLPLPEVVDHMLHASGLLEHYKTEREGADRIENLEELINAAATFEEHRGEEPVVLTESGDPAPELDSLTAFLAHASLEAGEHQALEGADALQMMTVHSAKGLEFHAVFVAGLEEGLFPHEQSMNEDKGLEEERRLMYVAITRARERLYMTFAQSRMLHGQTRYSLASRFFDEVPAELQKWLTPRIDTASVFQQGGNAFGNSPGGGYGNKPNNNHLRSGYSANSGGGYARGATTGSSANTPDWAKAIPGVNQPAPRRDTSDAGGARWKIGQNVAHPKFGSGVIVNTEGNGADARVQVNFARGGAKWLALEYAKLTAA